MDLVWLKRDVRLSDHEPLTLACSSGWPFMLLYMYEPDQLLHETMHGSHIAFVNEGLRELENQLRKLSGKNEPCITTRHGEATAIMEALYTSHPFCRLLSHEESGHNASYARDKRVKQWCLDRDVSWIEVPQSGVVRGLSLRDPCWHDICNLQAESFFALQPKESPFERGDAKKVLSRLITAHTEGFLKAEDLGLPSEFAGDRADRQRGGESRALELLSSFLDSRGEKYAGGGTISSPNSAWTQCSRLSPYYSWGHISIRTVVHAVNKRQAAASGRWAKSLEAYLVRILWRRSRMQDFEMRCWMEHRSVFQPWEHLRQGEFTFMFGDPSLLGKTTEQQRIAAFEQGKTGYPMVDACMRCLLHTGWLNFRMRCMLASFATFNLWLDWRAIKGHLARCFLDYEPGIHYVQLQLHAGTFGGMCHCYSVRKQAVEQDPEGVFIRKYVPELANVPQQFIHEPWKMSERPSARSRNRRWTTRYPMPIVDDRRTAEASRKVIEEAQQKTYAGKATAVAEDRDSEDEMLQLALKASIGDETINSGVLKLDQVQLALQEAEDAELQRAIEASLAGA
eukprot:TRINITY_DN24758_c0_g1_i1.p1 TRINITY_DN24758_c0_g1~~TRINITY_DN24758_c0_g1_i1.p1  ORF type:complete len:567 (+),score=71.26 TRINITY_DN24758_c0_g1_i1:58-1758(+)